MKHEYKAFYRIETSKISSSLYPEFAKPFKRRMSQIGWVTMKVILRTALLNVYNNNGYTIMALCLDKMLNLPNTLDGASIYAPIIDFYSKEALSQLNLFFFKKFYNLRSPRFNNAINES
jgi:hypothetical protein